MLRHRSALFPVALLAMTGLLVAACGSDGGPGATAPPAPAEPAAPGDPPPPAEPAPEPTESAPAPPEAPAEPAPAPPEPTPTPMSEEPATTTTAAEEPPEPTTTTQAAPATTASEASSEVETQADPADDPADGADSGSAAPEPASDFSVTITSDGGTWTLDSPPQRIVSLSPAATEILFAIGAGPQVVAVDDWSTYPPEAPTTNLSGFDPNVEAVSSFEPDLVVIAFDTNDLVAGLVALDIPVLVSTSPFDISGGYREVAVLGAATGQVTEAREVIETMRAGIDEALAAAPTVPIRIYHELDQTYFSVSSNSFIGAVYAALGTVNIADPADSDGYGFPQLTEEYIIEADPQLIVITDLTAYTADDVAARPGWESISAVRDGNILVVNADIASRWGPRLPQFVGAVAEALAAIAAADDG